MTQTTTQRERLASLESYVDGHAREHELTERVWETKLDAIDARLAQIERVLTDGRENGNGGGKMGIVRRDLGLAGGAAALTSALWWLAELLQTAAAGA